ncbi:MAG: chemotaxis protein CheB [bacterium]
MGASAGGLDAFGRFFQGMPSESGMAFVLITHLSPTHHSLMPELLKKYTKMEVCQADEGMHVKPNCIYVIPPNKNIAILQGTLQLIAPVKPHGSRLPIDFFFQSLAEDQGERAIGIILSGTGTDGTHGLRAIKAKLGMVMAQDAKTAEYDSMPRSATETGLVDYILPVEKMPDQLIKYVNHTHPTVREKILPVTEKGAHALQKIIYLIRAQTGHDFSFYKKNTIYRRIERRINIHQIDRISDYVRYLQQNPNEIDILFKDLLIGVTSFFRDPDAFEVIGKDALPKLFAKKSDGDKLRVWVAGCSSGEEVYSVAIVIRECLDTLKRKSGVQIFGTDIDKDAINTARTGIYPENISADVSPERLMRFFVKQGNTYHICQEIREMAIFSIQNIVKDPPFTKLDLICCRNFLIYLDAELQKKLLPIFHYALKPGGILFLGSSETITGFGDLFSIINKKWKIFQCKETSLMLRHIVDFPHRFPDGGIRKVEIPLALETLQPINMSGLVERTLLEEFAPPCVIIDEKGEIIYFHGRTGKYLEPASGKASLNIFEMIREGLKLELASLIRRAISKKEGITKNNLEVRTNGDFQLINLTVKPFKETKARQGLMMVVFEEATSPQKRSVKKRGRKTREDDHQITEMEEELRFTKESLHATIEELETANEELKSANEELQSTNEELQSTNEELETSKEELQSLNEELSTVNMELQGRNDDLSTINNDMRNLFESIEIATIFLDNHFCVRRFTTQSNQIINLIQADIGRPLSHIVSNLKYEKLMEDATEVLKNLTPIEKEVQTMDGHCYFMRMTPYRTTENVIDGVVMTFVDIQKQKEATERLFKLTEEMDHAREYYENILNTVRESLIVMDKDLRIISCNRSFYTTFRVMPEDTEGRLIYEIGNGQWDIPRLRELLEKIIPSNTIFENYEVEHDFPMIGQKKMILNARKIYKKEPDAHLILLAIEDISSIKGN